MSSTAVEQIKEKLSIVDVVAPYTELKQAGRHFKGKSPFVNEKTPSFFVSPDRGMYYCFSTNKGGDIFTFIEEMEGIDFKGALTLLAERAGVELVKEDPKKRSERDKKYLLLEEATTFYEKELQKSNDAFKYLKSRGVASETIAQWRIGYAPNAWRDVKTHLTKSTFTDSEMRASGLIKGDAGKEPYDVFRDRIMFPISDASSRVVAFSGRLLTPDENAPKYVNSPETELFNKSEILFGYDKAKQGIRKFDFSLLVEGQFDLVLAHQAGYTNTVAVSGTALSEHHVMLLQRLSNRAVLALDADRAGIEAIKKAAHIMLARAMDVKVAHIEPGKDPADVIAEDPELFKKSIGSGTHVIEFLLSVLKRETKDERAFKLRAREEILPYVLLIPDHIDREHFVSVIAKELQTTKDAIMYEVDRLEEAGRNKKKEPAVDSVPTHTSKKVYSRSEDMEEYLRTLTSVLVDMPTYTSYARILEVHIEKIIAAVPSKRKSMMSEEESQRLLFETEREVERYSEKELVSDIVSKLNEFHKGRLRSALTRKKEIIKEAESIQDNEKIATVLHEIAEMQKMLSLVEYKENDFLENQDQN